MRESTRRGLQGSPLWIIPSLKTPLVIILLTGLLWLPVAGSPLTTSISPDSQPGTHMSAAEYESQGIALMNEGNWSGLASVTGEGLAVYPDNAELHCLRGYLLRMTGHYPEAVDNVTFGIARDPKPIRYANRGFAYLAMGRNEDALDDANTAIFINSSYPRAYAVKAIALMNTGNMTGADQAIDTALLLDSSDPLFWHLKGKISANSGQCTRALDEFNRSLSINPDYVLPWPGFDNATTDLRRTESQCLSEAGTSDPIRVVLPVEIIIGALVLVIVARKR
jgi:tetratricopeptide (TPR) repeat protein